MDNSDERDYAEEQYNRDLCPGCDHSPCIDPEVCKVWEEPWERQDRRMVETSVDRMIRPLPPRTGETVEVYFPEFRRYKGELYD